jgi:two-component system, OmpR family, sensor kinase
MRLPGGIRLKLALALLAIVGGSLLAAYAIVVPSLERRLVDAKLQQQRADAETLAATYARLDATTGLDLDNFVDSAAFVANSRVVVFSAIGSPFKLIVRADSSAVGTDEITLDPVAAAAVQDSTVRRAKVAHAGREYAEVAIPLHTSGDVMLLSGSLADQLATVHLVERRLLDATGVALLIAFGLGLSAAAVHARRITRLQRAADRIAQGAFDEPVLDVGNDELGGLASSFDRMRVELAQLDRARKEFVANASHELRTPLFSLAGFLELLADEDLDESTRREFLATTRSQVDRLTKLATDLLDLSRMDAGRLRLEQEEIALAETVRVLAEELGTLADASGHTIEVDADDDAWAFGDEERVLQIGRALAGNALLHTPRGTRVVLRALRHGDGVALAVEDDGPGVPAAHLERVFHRFHRVEGAQASGSGLGLAIARELAERMGGTVVIDSRPGRTVFTLQLPAAPAPQRSEPAPLPV